MDLHVVWFVLLGVLLAGYAVLDGFDLGVGILHLFGKDEDERRIFLNSIGPIWDGNEVWLVTFGGALFAAFPEAYATILSGFYDAVMLLLFALVFRAVSIEFRGKVVSKSWRKLWDVGFALSSIGATLIFGMGIGNGMRGIPLNERGLFIGSFSDLLSPYSVLCGLLTVAMFAMHGALYLNLKVPLGKIHDRVTEWGWHTWGAFLVLYILTTVYTLIYLPHTIPTFAALPLGIVISLNVCAIANIPRCLFMKRPGQAFISSSLAIVLLVTLFSLALWPNLITASNDPANSLTIYRAASSPGTLKRMFIIALIGMPLVIAYTSVVYWTFRRRVDLKKEGY